MANNIELEYEVTEALRTGYKIKAIKKLRELRGTGLKEAKDLVDAYCEQHKISRPIEQSTNSGIGIFSLILTVMACYFAYHYFV